MSLPHSCLLMYAWFSAVTLAAQQSPSKELALFTHRPYGNRGRDAIGMESNTLKTLKGGGPYWILFQTAQGSVVNPLFLKAPDSRAKILLMLPPQMRGFGGYQSLAGAVQTNQNDGNQF